jgi:ABC-type dipeptide/oligopeptide/nickel transport system permease component
LVTLLIASVIVFVLARISGNPADLVLAPEATPAEHQEYIERMGFDRPLLYLSLLNMPSGAADGLAAGKLEAGRRGLNRGQGGCRACE